MIHNSLYRALLIPWAVTFAVGLLGCDDPNPVAAPRPATPLAKSAPSVTPPAVRFRDITQEAGIDFVHVNGATGERLLPESMGGGLAFFDYDNDGDQDLLLVNSRHWSERLVQPPDTLALYRNDGNGHFERTGAGLSISSYGMGVAIGDIDNDGWRDVFITALGENHLFRNERGRFVDITEQAAVAGEAAAWSTAAAFFDYDKDGDLDLFVANYVLWSREIDFGVDFRLDGIGRAYGPPTAFQGSQPYLYRNDGAGTFTDVSAASGVRVSHPDTGLPMAKGLALALADVDSDGWLDVFLANDTVRNFFYRNRGDGTFEEIGALLGLAFDRDGAATGAMGADAAYYRNDSDLALAVGNFANEMTSFYVTQGTPELFADEAIVSGLGAATRQSLTFGLFFFDYDLDGRLDLLQANGHVEPDIHNVQASQRYAQPAQLFWNCGLDCGSGFLPVPPAELGDFAKPLVGRGAAYADIDSDGDLDVILTQTGGAPLLLRNEQSLGHHWLRIKLVGKAGNRDAIGAWVELTAAGVTQRRQVMPTKSYLAQVELPLTFGLGTAQKIESLRVIWPDGTVQELAVPELNSTVVIRYPQLGRF